MSIRAISRTSIAVGLATAFVVVAAPASADDAALLMFKTDGQINASARDAFVEAAESTLASGQTPTLVGLADAEARLSGVAPEILQCDETSCLERAGQALELDVGYTIAVTEEFESYTIDVVAWDLTSGNLLARRQETCDICTSEEAVASLVTAATDVTSGWTAPGAAATPQPTPKVTEPKVTEPARAVPGEVKVAVYVDPPDASIHIDGRRVGAGKFVGTLVPGAHTVRVERSGYTTSEKSFDLESGDGAFHLAFDLRPTDTSTIVTQGRTGGLIDETDPNILAWSFTGAGAVLTIGGAVLLGIDGEGTCEGGDLATCPEVFETTAGGAVMLGLGMASLTAGITFFLWDELAGTRSDAADEERPRGTPRRDDVSAGLGLGVGLTQNDDDEIDGGVVTFGTRF